MDEGVSGLPDDPGETLRRLGVDSENGLQQSEAELRLKKSGLNSIPESTDGGIFQILLEQVKEPMILILVFIGLIYLLVGTPIESITVIVIVFIVIAIETYNVRKARISMLALKSLVSSKAWVIRGGAIVELPVSNIVSGDIVIIHSGEKVPADGIILESFDLDVDESSLSGESIPVHKQAYSNSGIEPSDSEKYLIMSGTLVLQGSGKFAVVSTGANTELGKVSESVRTGDDTKTPLEISLRRTSGVLIGIAVFFSFLIPLIGYVHGNPLDLMVLTGLSMAFATVPEELPILITITLAVGAYSLAKKKAIVKSLKAAQTLGTVTVIATDKTGTLTENRMSVGHVMQGETLYDANNVADGRLLLAGVLATGTLTMGSRGSEIFRDPMERSVFEYAKKYGIDFEKVRHEFVPENEFAFDGTLKLASYIYKTLSGQAIFTSGAPETVLGRCSGFTTSDGVETTITDEQRKIVLDTVENLAASGERTIAISYKGSSEIGKIRNDSEKDLIFLGLFSFIDPPRKGVREAVEMCQNAGIRVIMLTGDHPNTARAIGRMVGIKGTETTITGDMVKSMSDEDLERSVRSTSIFARINHGQKLRIVRSLQKLGETVAVTGDGVNDAPALRSAEIGIAMGKRGSDVAKEASDMILEDDNFQTIADAVFEGRKMQYTLRKGIRYYISVKLSLISILLIPVILVIPFPFLPIQIIIMELFMDVGALWGFLYENNETGIVERLPPGFRSRFITKEMMYSISLGAAGIFIAVTTVYLYLYYVHGNIVQAQMGAFATWMLSQVILAQNLRTEYQPVTKKGFFSNPIILAWGIIIVGMLVTVSVYSPLHSIIDTSSLGLHEWLMIVIAAILSSSWMEIIKFSRKEYRTLRRKETAS